LGCGEYPAFGWYNVDVNTTYGVKSDVTMDVTREFPVEVGVAEKIYAGHILEHIEYDIVIDVLNFWYGHAATGCELLVVGPDSDRGRAMRAAGQLTDEELAGLGINHVQGYGFGHLWESTEANTRELMDKSLWTVTGMQQIEHVPPPWPITSRIGWQFAIFAAK
jgi:hypothetical protein